MFNATTKPQTVQGMSLNTPADMGDALNAALTLGFRGKIEAYIDANTNTVWHIELNGPGIPVPVSAALGDVLTWDGQRLQSMTQEQFDSNYTLDGG